jgi:carboxylesterase type B
VTACVLRHLRTVFVLALLLLCGCAARRVSAPPRAAAPQTLCSSPIVQTTSGPVCGLDVRVAGWGSPSLTAREYLGIHYAESPAGQRRWTPPVAYAHRSEVLRATAFGPVCPQPNLNPSLTQSEDCLTINVWTPQAPRPPANGWPVMVFIYGGSFLVGGSRAGVYDGARLATTGPVAIASFNYRLGALGFLAGIEGMTGNYGFLDQQMALEWVRDNIRAFGGDPDRVTIFGESAGAMSVGLHLISPQSRGLFRAAIMESNPYGIPYKSETEARDAAERLRDGLGCGARGIECMRSAPLDAIVRHQTSDLIVLGGLLEGLRGDLVWAPVVDDVIIPTQPIAASARLPLLMGTNLDEGELFVGGFRIKIPFERREVHRIEYEAALHLLFKDSVVRRIEQRPSYAPVDRDNTQPFSQLLTDYVFTCANRHFMDDASGRVYAYQFAHRASYNEWPGVPLCAPDQRRVCHSFELPFVFGNPVDVRLATPPPGPADRFSAHDEPTAEAMMGYWTRFAALLEPNHEGAPRWPQFHRRDPIFLEFTDRISQLSELGANCDFWDSVGYDSHGLFSRN